jgi:SAM-dependent methyltransferase
MKRHVFDLDGTLCTETAGKYEDAEPFRDRIARVNALHEAGDHIIIDTGRGPDWRMFTENQLRRWDVKHHALHVGRKPHAHCYVDATAIPADDFFAGHVDRWPDAYFAQRQGNDPRRRQAFRHEMKLLMRHISFYDTDTVCDVGCSTGEFLWEVFPSEAKYGMEISAHARAAAERRGVSFSRDILNSTDYFDVVIFRGTVQHLPRPFSYLARAHAALRPGGTLAILATPNTGSLVYRLFGRFPPPLSDDARNYWMPSAAELTNALKNLGFEILEVEYPYRGAGYDRPLHDALGFARRLFLGQWSSFAWPGNLMNVIARKSK